MNKNREELFEEISKLCNFCDPELVRSIYYAMVRVISRGVKSGKRVVLPNWGTYLLIDYAPRQVRVCTTGKIRSVKMTKVLKFVPCTKVKAYFKGLE